VHDDQSVLSGDASIWNGSLTAMDWDDATDRDTGWSAATSSARTNRAMGHYGAPSRPTVDLLTDIEHYGGNRQITAAQRAAFRADLRYWHTAIVVVSADAPHHDELRYALKQLTGQPARQVPGAVLWDVGALSG
jgi:hypothetical protein